MKPNASGNSNTHHDDMIAYILTNRDVLALLDIYDNRFWFLQRTENINDNQVTDGTLVLIFMDSSTQQEVWRGFISGTINPKSLDKDVNKSVAKLIQKFVKNQSGKN